MAQPASGEFIYTVRATFQSRDVADEWVEWLVNGHAQALVHGGAISWQIEELDAEPSDAHMVAACVRQIRYRFPSRAAFQRYEREFAPALRAEGAQKFPPERGVKYERSTATTLAGGE